jgi:putative hydrolase of the HAD superfamily
MPFETPAAILFDVDGTLMDDDGAVLSALTSFHSRLGAELGISADDLVEHWRELLNLHFARYLMGEITMQEQRRARIIDLFAASKINLSLAMADRIFAAYESDYRASWTAYPDALPALDVLNGYKLAILSNGDLAQQTQKLRICGLASYFSAIFTSRSDIQSQLQRLSRELASGSAFLHSTASMWETAWKLTLVPAPPQD